MYVWSVSENNGAHWRQYIPAPQLTVIGCGVFGRAMVDGIFSEPYENQSYSLALTHRRKEAAENLQIDYWSQKTTQILEYGGPQGNRHIVVIGTQPQYTADVCHDITKSFTSVERMPQLVMVTVCLKSLSPSSKAGCLSTRRSCAQCPTHQLLSDTGRQLFLPIVRQLPGLHPRSRQFSSARLLLWRCSHART